MTEIRTGGRRTGELLDGRYRLDERIGEGGMATVYRARDEALQRTVAVKVFRDDTGETVDAHRARSEVALLASLSHHSLVTLYDAHFGSGPDFLVMEYVEGRTLSELIAAGPIDSRELAAIAVDLAEALHVVHAEGIVHRDVKPSNVLLRPVPIPGRKYRPKLADFGIAYLLESTHLTAPQSIIGTAAYLAPEQVLGKGASPASDIYALGLLLIEALTGARAFAHIDAREAMVARVTVAPVIPVSIESGWSALLSSMVAIAPEDRPAALDVVTRASALAAGDTKRPGAEPPPTVLSATTTPPDALHPPATALTDATGIAAEKTSVLPTVDGVTEVFSDTAAPAVRPAVPESAAPQVPETRAPTVPAPPVAEPAVAAAQAATPIAPPHDHSRRSTIGLVVVVVVLCLAIAAVVIWWLLSPAATPHLELPELVEPLNTNLRELLEEVTP